MVFSIVVYLVHSFLPVLLHAVPSCLRSRHPSPWSFRTKR